MIYLLLKNHCGSSSGDEGIDFTFVNHIQGNIIQVVMLNRFFITISS